MQQGPASGRGPGDQGLFWEGTFTTLVCDVSTAHGDGLPR